MAHRCCLLERRLHHDSRTRLREHSQRQWTLQRSTWSLRPIPGAHGERRVEAAAISW